MLICPECRNSQREGTGVCAECGHRFAPGHDDVTEPRKSPRARGRVSRAAVWGIIGIVAVASLMLFLPGATASPAQAGLDRYVARLSRLIENSGGAPDPAAVNTLTLAAESETGCGHIHPFFIPASAVGGGAPATPGQPSPLSAVHTYITTTMKAEHVSVGFALDEQVVVAAGAWGCG